MKLYEITGAYAQIEQMLDNPDIGEADLLQAIDEVDGALKEKAQNIAMAVRNLETTAEAIKEAETHMAERRKSIENKVKSIKDYVLRCMTAAGVTKIECEYFRMAIRNNPQKVVIDDENAIPLAYLRQPEPPPPAPDKKAMLADMKQGVVIDGAHMEQTQSLVIT